MPIRILAAGAFAGALVVNALANRLPLGGRTTGELSALYPNLFVPAGVTFSIWGPIYLLVGAWAVAQFFPSRAELGRRIAPHFALSSLLNAGWLLAWHYERVVLSLLIMLALLAVLLRLNVVMKERSGEAMPGLLPRAAFGIYLGWILVATLVNATALLVAFEWDGTLAALSISDRAWAIILVLIGAAAAVLTLRTLRNAFVGLAVVWAFGGIALNRWHDVPSIAWTAIGMMGLVGVFTAAEPLRRLRHSPRYSG